MLKLFVQAANMFMNAPTSHQLSTEYLAGNIYMKPRFHKLKLFTMPLKKRKI